MSKEMRFTLIAVDGEPGDLSDSCTQSLRYDDLSWDESVELARLSFMQGYAVIVWQVEGGGGRCAEA